MYQRKCIETLHRFWGLLRSGQQGGTRPSIIVLAWFFFMIPVSFSLFSLPASAEMLDRLAAMIDEEIITYSELNEAVNLYLHQMGKTEKSQPSGWEKQALERKVLEELIDKKLMDNYAKSQGIEATEEEITSAIDDVIARAAITPDQLKEALKRDGLRYEEYRDQIRDQIVKAKMIHREIRARIKVKEEEIEGYYFDHPQEFRSDEGVEISHILLPLPQDPSPEIIEETAKRAQEIRLEIDSGLAFGEAAAKYSKDASALQGGKLGFFRREALSPEIGQAVSTLEVGEISAPVHSAIGIHLIKLDDLTEGGIRPLEKVRDVIQENLYEEAAERQFEEWRKELRKNAYIKVLL